MRTAFLFFLLVLYSACDPHKTCNMYYFDASGQLCVNGELTNNLEEGRFIFYDMSNERELVSVGFFKNGFRRNLWTYNFHDELKQIEWAYYKDKNLGFETNLFARGDSATYGDFFTTITFKGWNKEKISLTVTIDSPLKDSLNVTSFETIMANEFEKLSLNMLNYQIDSIYTGRNTIYLYSFIIKSDSSLSDKPTMLRGAFCFLPTKNRPFIDFSISNKESDSFLAHELFKAVFSSFYFSGERLYFPYSKEPKIVF